MIDVKRNLEFERAASSKFESGYPLEEDSVVGRCAISVDPVGPVRELRVRGKIRQRQTTSHTATMIHPVHRYPLPPSAWLILSTSPHTVP